MSGATETSALTESTDQSSSTGTQTESTATETTATSTPESTTEQSRPDYRRLQREDPDLNAHIQRELAKARKSWERNQLRSTAKSAVETEDADTALKLAAQIASETDDEDEDSGHTAQWSASAAKVRPHLDRMLRLDSTGQVTNPHYVALYNKVGKAEMDRRYAEDPEAFLDWASDQIDEIKFDATLKKRAPSLYQSGKADAENAALRNSTNLPPSTAGSAAQSDADFIKAYADGKSDDHARWQKIARTLR